MDYLGDEREDVGCVLPFLDNCFPSVAFSNRWPKWSAISSKPQLAQLPKELATRTAGGCWALVGLPAVALPQGLLEMDGSS